MSIRTVISVVVMGLLCATTALAVVPTTINFQGTLTDSSGNPLNELIQRMTFSVYADSAGGSSLWNESKSNVPVTDGLFQVTLGTSNPFPVTLFNGSIRWLGILISPDAVDLSPRQRIVSVPYRFKSEYADSAGFADVAATDNDWTLFGISMYRQTGNVGIGTTNPQSKLHVEGVITVDQMIKADDAGGLELATDEGAIRLKINDNGYVGVGTSSPATSLDVQGTITVDQKIKADDSGGLELATDEGTTRLKISDNGNVGVGTTTPTSRLQVVGGMSVGSNGTSFLEIMKITGTTAASGTFTTVPYPSGYSNDNSCILAAEVGTPLTVGLTWQSLGAYAASEGGPSLHCHLDISNIYLQHPDQPWWHNQPYLIWIMKMQ